MADEKTANFEETKWWIDRGPVKERDKSAEPIKGIIEKWAYELLKNYNQDQAAKQRQEASGSPWQSQDHRHQETSGCGLITF